MKTEMPKVMECSVDQCAYNSGKNCHALAITVGDPGGDPACDTFFTADRQGGLENVTAGVGACKQDSCKFNQDFECSAEDIIVGMQNDQADCMTYTARS